MAAVLSNYPLYSVYRGKAAEAAPTRSLPSMYVAQATTMIFSIPSDPPDIRYDTQPSQAEQM